MFMLDALEVGLMSWCRRGRPLVIYLLSRAGWVRFIKLAIIIAKAQKR